MNAYSTISISEIERVSALADEHLYQNASRPGWLTKLMVDAANAKYLGATTMSLCAEQIKSLSTVKCGALMTKQRRAQGGPIPNTTREAAEREQIQKVFERMKSRQRTDGGTFGSVAEYEFMFPRFTMFSVDE